MTVIWPCAPGSLQRHVGIIVAHDKGLVALRVVCVEQTVKLAYSFGSQLTPTAHRNPFGGKLIATKA